MGKLLQRIIPIIVMFVLVLSASCAFAQTDKPGSKDYPGITRVPGYYISDYKVSQFDSFSFKVTEGSKEKDQPVEGHRYDIRYDLKKNATAASALQIVRNYQNAIRSAGGKVLREAGQGNDRETTVRFAKGGSEVWLAVRALSGVDKIIQLIIIEKQAMQQQVTVDAAAMASSITNTGSVAIYGIYFDTAKSDLKPESGPALAEIAKLLKHNPTLKVYIVGHTDMAGDAASNVKLSQARAQSVVRALVTKHAIAGTRLIAFGVGSYAPVASNRTEDGRAKNRRVELVEIATK